MHWRAAAAAGHAVITRAHRSGALLRKWSQREEVLEGVGGEDTSRARIHAMSMKDTHHCSYIMLPSMSAHQRARTRYGVEPLATDELLVPQKVSE